MNALLPQFHNFISVTRECAIKCQACAASPRAAAAMEEATHTSRAALAFGDSSGGENIGRPGLRSSEPSWFRSSARVCKFHAADHSVNARIVSSRGFGCAAGFCMFQLSGKEPQHRHCPPPTQSLDAESILHVGDVVVRRQDTSRARVPGHLLFGFRRRVDQLAAKAAELRCTESALRRPHHHRLHLGRRSQGVRGMRWLGL